LDRENGQFSFGEKNSPEVVSLQHVGIHLHFFQLPPCKTNVKSFDTKLVANISHQLTSHRKKKQPGTGGPSGPAPLIDSYFH
jgi:hypothetical protein